MSKTLLILLKFTLRTIVSLIGLSVLVVIPLLILSINPFIRSKALVQLKEQFPNAVVNIESAEFIRGQGVRLRGLRIRFPKSAFLESQIVQVKESELVLPKSKSGLYDFVTVEEMFIVSKQSIKDLFLNGLSIERVQLRNADLVLYPVDKERWNYQFLHFATHKKHAPFREVELDDVDCHLRDYRRSEAICELRDIKAKMKLVSENEYDVIGVMTGDYARSLTYSGRINLSKKQMVFEADVKQCELSDRLYNALPLEALPRDEIGQKLAELRLVKNVSGIMSSKAYFSYDDSAEPGQKLKYRVVGQALNGRWDWNASSEPLTNIQIKYDVSEKEANIQSFSANMGAGKIQMSYRQWTYEKNAPKEIALKLENIQLSNKILTQTLQIPQKVLDIWKSIQPSGLITADAHIKFDGQTWAPNVKLQCQNGTLLYDKFPYPLSNLAGTIELNSQTVRLNLTDNANIVLDGEFTVPSELFAQSTYSADNNLDFSQLKKSYGYFQVKARNIAISDKVINACPEKAQELIHQFDPKGNVNVDVRLDVRGNGTPMDLVVDIALLNCSGRYEPFPYPLNNLNGRLYMKNHFWTFENLTVNTTPVKITGSGRVNLQTNEPHDFFLNLKLIDLPVDRVLSSSMPEQNAKLIEELGITGAVNAQVDISMRLGVDTGPKLKIHAVPTGKEFSLHANSFPYRLEKVSGTIDYEDGRFTVKDFTGYHNQTLLCCQIDGMVIPGSGWKAKLSKTAVDRLKVDRDLIDAMPESIRKNITSLNLNGPLHYRGEINLTYNNKVQNPLSAVWNGEIGVQEVSINKGIELYGICGGITTAGYMANGNFYSEGQLSIESALWNRIQFSSITGPYQINNQLLFLGTGAPEVLKWIFPSTPNSFRRPIHSAHDDGKPQRLSAKLFGGDFFADIVTISGEDSHFCVNLFLKNARLEQCGEVTQSERLSGKFNASVIMFGKSGDLNSLRGKGMMHLEEADIYHLPFMVSMLKLLSIKEPSQNAFSNAEADFQITGRRLFFKELNFRGDAISLYGSGEMDFNKRVNMSFYTLVGKGEYNIPLFHNVYRDVSKNVMRIRMEGPINQLQIRRESPILGE